MSSLPQPNDVLQTSGLYASLRRAIENEDDAQIVGLYTATDLNWSGTLTPQEQVRVDLAIRRINTKKSRRAALPYAVGGLVLIVAAIAFALGILPRWLARPTTDPTTSPDEAAGLSTQMPLQTPDAALAGAQGRAASQKQTPTPDLSGTLAPIVTSTSTPVPTQAQEKASTLTPTATATPRPSSTPVPTHAATATTQPSPTPIPTHTATTPPTSTHTATATPRPGLMPTSTHTPTNTPPPSSLRPAPRLESPPNGAEFSGWNAEVILSWSGVGSLAADEYYVVRIPYDDAGSVAEFWRKETSFKVPPHFSGREVGFPDRHYSWTVQAMRCIKNCPSVTDDNVAKTGEATGAKSAEGLFYWHPDIGGGAAPVATPTRE